MIKTDWLKEPGTCLDWTIRGPKAALTKTEFDEATVSYRQLRRKAANERKREREQNRTYYRMFMEEMLGRPLCSNEDVHHKNGDFRDDRPENLEVLSHKAHFEHHQKKPVRI